MFPVQLIGLFAMMLNPMDIFVAQIELLVPDNMKEELPIFSNLGVDVLD
jgi:hypothetical protein